MGLRRRLTKQMPGAFETSNSDSKSRSKVNLPLTPMGLHRRLNESNGDDSRPEKGTEYTPETDTEQTQPKKPFEWTEERKVTGYEALGSGILFTAGTLLLGGSTQNAEGEWFQDWTFDAPGAAAGLIFTVIIFAVATVVGCIACGRATG